MQPGWICQREHVCKLINGEVQLAPEVAVRLETVLGVPAHFWNNLEAIYREKLLKVEAENAMEVVYRHMGLIVFVETMATEGTCHFCFSNCCTWIANPQWEIWKLTSEGRAKVNRERCINLVSFM